MSLTKDDIALLRDMMVQTIMEVVGPMFEQQTEDLGGRIDKVEGRMDKLEGRMDKLEGRMDKLENEVHDLQREFRDFKSYMTSRLDALDTKVDHLEELYNQRFGYVEEDVTTLYQLVQKLEDGTKEEKVFAEKAIVKHLPAIYRAVTAIAKKYNLDLSNA